MTLPGQADVRELAAGTGFSRRTRRHVPVTPSPATPALWVVGEEEMFGLKKRPRKENSLVKPQRAGCE